MRKFVTVSLCLFALCLFHLFRHHRHCRACEGVAVCNSAVPLVAPVVAVQSYAVPAVAYAATPVVVSTPQVVVNANSHVVVKHRFGKTIVKVK